VKEHTSTSIDLQLSASIPDEYFNGESDKLNFYKEIEGIDSIEELSEIQDNFKIINPDFSPETSCLFDLLKLKILA
jgi:transcription-repair coupling factor (superfamily II helicase)